MKKLILNISCLALIGACSSPVNQEAQQALVNYTHFVDSIYTNNEIWRTTNDTDFVEYPTDPNDPTVTALDTIVTMPDKKAKSLVVSDYWGKLIAEQYQPLKVAVESKLEKMDDRMKKEYESARLKFEEMESAK
jgi:hypothetical protein